ncbi:flavodoxin family protein [Marvinbryantia formatexigens]|nr:flavodoxin [Marvinbryantia formatexigens]UWO26354.1 NAD(P)H-dependent oxidoreductase [Marvinbryantia formatexigens DSM 14469]
MKTLIIYYSYGGNTRRIAEMIQKRTGGDIAEIETVKPYTGSYDSVVNQGQREVNSGYMPEIQPLTADVQKYDRIILGSPVWWYTFAPAMKTFLNTYDLSGKIVYPFATNGGWIGHTFRDFEKECRGADVRKGLNVKFDEAVLRTPEKEIEAWIDGIGM